MDGVIIQGEPVAEAQFTHMAFGVEAFGLAVDGVLAQFGVALDFALIGAVVLGLGLVGFEAGLGIAACLAGIDAARGLGLLGDDGFVVVAGQGGFAGDELALTVPVVDDSSSG